MFNLYRKKSLILIFSILAVTMGLQAQYTNAGNYNYSDFQKKPYYFGITLSYNTSDYKIFRSNAFKGGSNSIDIVDDINGPGFNLGIITNLKVGENFDFRFLPTLSFAERTISYTTGVADDIISNNVNTIESVFIEIPFHARYKSAPYRDMRFFLIGGIKYSYDVAGKSRRKRDQDLIKIAYSDFSLEVGAGVQFFFPFFILSPEFKISQGISNVLINEPIKNESNVIDKILSRTFTFSLHFEG